MSKPIQVIFSEIQEAAQALFELTRELSLLQVMSDSALEVLVALDALSEQLNGLQEDAFKESILDSELINLLDEIVDVDAISELEEHLFETMDSIDDTVLGVFLTELLEKIERRYTRLIEAVHELNALLGE